MNRSIYIYIFFLMRRRRRPPLFPLAAERPENWQKFNHFQLLSGYRNLTFKASQDWTNRSRAGYSYWSVLS